MSDVEYSGWVALYNVEPFGEDRQDMRMRRMFLELISSMEPHLDRQDLYDSLDYLKGFGKSPAVEPTAENNADEFAETRANITAMLGGR